MSNPRIHNYPQAIYWNPQWDQRWYHAKMVHMGKARPILPTFNFTSTLVWCDCFSWNMISICKGGGFEMYHFCSCIHVVYAHWPSSMEEDGNLCIFQSGNTSISKWGEPWRRKMVSMQVGSEIKVSHELADIYKASANKSHYDWEDGGAGGGGGDVDGEQLGRQSLQLNSISPNIWSVKKNNIDMK